MKKSLFIVILTSFVLALSAACLTSCEEYVLPELSADPDTLIFPAAGGPLEMNVKANVHWTIDIIPGYDKALSCNPYFGDGDARVIITAEPNTGSLTKREYTLKSETITRKLTIIQEGI